MIHAAVWDSPIGPLTLAEDGVGLCLCAFGAQEVETAEMGDSDLLRQARDELISYFAGTRRVFDLPLSLRGTAFQAHVWEALRRIPYGQTRTYAEIALEAGSPRGYRAVGMACNRNPVAIIVPCHRVIGAHKDLVGFGGGLETKRTLLELEGVHTEA